MPRWDILKHGDWPRDGKQVSLVKKAERGPGRMKHGAGTACKVQAFFFRIVCIYRNLSKSAIGLASVSPLCPFNTMNSHPKARRQDTTF